MSTPVKSLTTRTKADPSLSVDDLSKPLGAYMQLVGHRNVYKILLPFDHITYSQGCPGKALSDGAQLFAEYSKICTSGVVPQSKHLLALHKLNTEKAENVGELKINFCAHMSNENFYKWVDDKVRIMMLDLCFCAYYVYLCSCGDCVLCFCVCVLNNMFVLKSGLVGIIRMSHYRKIAHMPDYRKYIDTKLHPDYRTNVYMVIHLLMADTAGCTTMALYTPPNVKQEGKQIESKLSRSFSKESLFSVAALAD